MRYPIHKRYEMSEREMRGDGWFERNGFKILVLGCAVYLLSIFAYASYALAFDYPPEEYRYTPTVPYEVRDVPLSQISEKCASVIHVDTRTACQTWEGALCVIYLPIVEPARRRSVRSRRGGRAVRYVRASSGLSWAVRETLRIHEEAHCNGWRHPVRGNVVFPSRSTATLDLQDKDQ